MLEMSNSTAMGPRQQCMLLQSKQALLRDGKRKRVRDKEGRTQVRELDCSPVQGRDVYQGTQ